MVCKDTLKIKNLPKELSDHQKEDFARHFGASKVKVITSRVKEKSVVYAKFDSEELAKTVLFRLHQITILNCRLCVEYAENDILQGKPRLKKIEEVDFSTKKSFKTFLNKLTAFNESVGFHQPPPSHLKYLYPKANRATINNIAHALATIPRFYTQVLHLMNRMNLPPPFAVEQPPVRMITPQHPPVQRYVEKPQVSQIQPTPVNQPPSTVSQSQTMTTQVQHILSEPPPVKTSEKPPESSSESEFESDDDGDYFRNREYIPMKRKIGQKKMVKRPKFIKPPEKPTAVVNPNAPQKIPEKVENVFDRVDVQVQKRIEVKVAPNTLELPKEDPRPEKIGVIGIIAVAPKTSEPIDQPEPKPMPEKVEEQATPAFPTISDEELTENQISPKDLGVLPVFKNYHPGAPTSRLYIKNIAKTVVTQDLEYIYNRYRSLKNDASQFDIRLMQEGRMKGQAFVTLDTIELAQKAVKETNGYILKEKPLVVVFAKSAVQKT